MVRKTAHFTITGEAFVHLARQRMLDDEPAAAYRLATSLGIDDPVVKATIPSIAMRILDGTATLDGDESGMDVVDQVDSEYRERLAWLFAGRVRLHGRWYQPVAYVSNVGRMDMRNDHGRVVQAFGGGYTNRAWHYCGKDEIVAELASYRDASGLERDVVFRACGERPHWHQSPIGAQAALDQFLAAGRRLEERSHAKWYGDEEWSPQGSRARYKGVEPNQAMAELLKEKEDEAARLRRVADLRRLILEQAGNDLIELAWEAKGEAPAGTAMIPRAPFVVWAFARLKWFQGLLPEWKPISPSGMKVWAMDDPVHTDWVIGGGFDPQDRDLYWGAKAKAAERLRSRLQDEFDDRKRILDESITTLVTGPAVIGVVTHARRETTPEPGMVVIVPDLRPQWLPCVAQAAAIITQAGGEIAHLAQIAREQAVPVVRADDALKRWTEGETVRVDPEARTVTRVVNDVE